jgi:hypothetical protein
MLQLSTLHLNQSIFEKCILLAHILTLIEIVDTSRHCHTHLFAYWKEINCLVVYCFHFSGLIDVWYEQVESAFVVHHLYTNRFDVYKTQAFTFHDIQTAFYILGIGMFIGTILFIIEIFVVPPNKKRTFFMKHKSKI